jgi:hypothetical protein
MTVDESSDGPDLSIGNGFAEDIRSFGKTRESWLTGGTRRVKLGGNIER